MCLWLINPDTEFKNTRHLRRVETWAQIDRWIIAIRLKQSASNLAVSTKHSMLVSTKSSILCLHTWKAIFCTLTGRRAWNAILSIIEEETPLKKWLRPANSKSIPDKPRARADPKNRLLSALTQNIWCSWRNFLLIFETKSSKLNSKKSDLDIPNLEVWQPPTQINLELPISQIPLTTTILNQSLLRSHISFRTEG